MYYNYSYMYEYPEIYHEVLPKVRECIYRHYPYSYRVYPYPYPYPYLDEDEVRIMVDEVYEEMIKIYPEIDKDPLENGRTSASRRRYGRRRLFKDLIFIILLNELLRGRRHPYYGYPGSRYVY
ncbi:hypothetical protein [Caloranaerobacter azorensis]|uniref:Uncharacterized protein n=1 Tax=Caloranaerobacter azorensis TaxID=116090 RepID=A0A6P1YD34_9FIRM|nr:hypothetical protein [Caloranaerobacter azorensis]QIB27249.1 hypothetical protein G3A45_08100 [Caloranaerobacter azorensis]